MSEQHTVSFASATYPLAQSIDVSFIHRSVWFTSEEPTIPGNKGYSAFNVSSHQKDNTA